MPKKLMVQEIIEKLYTFARYRYITINVKYNEKEDTMNVEASKGVGYDSYHFNYNRVSIRVGNPDLFLNTIKSDILDRICGKKKPMVQYNSSYYRTGGKLPMGIKEVIFNDPATIVFWEDGVKTVVRAHSGDKFDPEKGLAMAIAKRAMGNKYDYYNTFVKHLKKYDGKKKKKGKK